MEKTLNEKIKRVINLVDNYNKNSTDSPITKNKIWNYWDEDSPISGDMWKEIDEAKQLSLEIAKELKEKDKGCYNFIVTWMKGDKLFELIELINNDKNLDISRYIEQNVKLYDLIVIEMDFENHESYAYMDLIGLLIFNSDYGLDYKMMHRYERNKFPSLWYSFCQLNGLLKSGAIYLYDLHDENIGLRLLKYSKKSWPYKFDTSIKLV